MSKIFIIIYEWFDSRKAVLYTVFALLILILSFFASKISFVENITSFFGQDQASSSAFDKIRQKDRLLILVSGNDADDMIEAGEIYADSLQSLIDEGLLLSITKGVDEAAVKENTDFIYEYLPIFLEEEDYQRIEASLTDQGIDSLVGRVYSRLISPNGLVLKDILLRDPLSLGTRLMSRFERFGSDFEYEIYGGHIFSPDLSSMLMFAEPAYGLGSTGDNDRLVEVLENLAGEVSELSGQDIVCLGGPVTAVHNARQIKGDISVTMTIALLIIIVFIIAAFKNRKTVPLMILPPLFGALFALALTYMIQGQISTIAIGAGSVVLGIALSYSIHVISHSNHSIDPKLIIRDLASPLTIGSFTTIGAFAALMFTSSPLLKDLGLFAVLALIGTAACCLIFLPHFLPRKHEDSQRPLLKFIEKTSGIPVENNKWIIAGICILTLVSLFFYGRVDFDDDLNNINYVPAHIAAGESRLHEAFGDNGNGILIASSSPEISEASAPYYQLDSLLGALVAQGNINRCFSVSDFIIPARIQEEKIDRWKKFWDGRIEETIARTENSALSHGFRKGALSGVEDILRKDYKVCGYSAATMSKVSALSDWVNPNEDGILILSRIDIEENLKPEVYELISGIPGTCIIDRAWFSSKMTRQTNDDFNFILWISSLIVFLALLISYGRLELALMSFLPMVISWVIILGFMAVLDIRFNIVNIILATFIFGIGDDFSIFIMDGLLSEYKSGKKLLSAHKTAIFFSAFTTIVGMGALLFARNPALKSIAVISVLGLAVVVLVSYTVQPFLFKLLISGPARKGQCPFTLFSLLNTVYGFLYFLIGALLSTMFALLLGLLPISTKIKRKVFLGWLHRFCRLYVHTIPGTKIHQSNPTGEDFSRKAIIIVNHQSLIDILIVLALCPKVVFLTNHWVRHSPVFGKIVREGDFSCIDDGYEKVAAQLGEKMAQGYSVVVFPEGSRSADCSIQRFHKGAFNLARDFKADIVPVVLYGAGKICAKNRPFYIKSCDLGIRIPGRFSYDDPAFGSSPLEQARKYRAMFKAEYEVLRAEFEGAGRRYSRDALMLDYIYKGPVIEWYMRLKMKKDGYYRLWDNLVPRQAVVTDVGCGYGQLALTLALSSPQRKVIGMDYDRDKILLAGHSYLCRENTNFVCADMRTCEMPQSDVFLMNDSLQYMRLEEQRQVLENCLCHLNHSGMILARDAVFASRDFIRSFATEHGLNIEIQRSEDGTSDTLYILKNA